MNRRRFLHVGAASAGWILLSACSQRRVRPEPPPAERLAGLMEYRLTLAESVARSKWASGAPIEDPVREQQVIATAQNLARVQGLDPEWVAHFYRAQIAAGKMIKADLHQRWRSGIPPTGAPEDLVQTLRPQFDAFNEDALPVLAEIRTWAHDAPTRNTLRSAMNAACRIHNWPPAVADAALAGWL